LDISWNYGTRRFLPLALRSRIPADVLLELEAEWARQVGFLQQRLADAERRNLVLEARLASLEDRLNKNSSNSSKPPSSDGPEVKQPPKAKSKRKRGGQPGHAQKERVILEPTQTIICKPKKCSNCQANLLGDDSNPQVYPYLDLPPILTQVIHFLLYRLKYACGCINRGQVPQEIIGHDGPGVLAMVVSLLGRHLSRRQVAEFMRTVCGVPMSVGNVCKIQNRMTKILAPTVQAVRTELRKKHNNIDETGLCQSNKPGWLWAASFPKYASYWVRLSRGKDAFEEIIGPDYKKVATTDRLRTYSHLSEDRHPFCWAHLLRDFQAMIDRKNTDSPIGRRLLKHSKHMFKYWF
jgi:transposase